jgi:flagellar basal body-associated protein FliL
MARSSLHTGAGRADERGALGARGLRRNARIDDHVISVERLDEGGGVNAVWRLELRATRERAYFKPVNRINPTVAYLFGHTRESAFLSEVAAYRLACASGEPFASLDEFAPGSLVEERLSEQNLGPDAPEKRTRPWGWIAACAVLVLVAGGLAIWALGTQSNLDDQKDQTAQAQQEGKQANDQIGAMEDQIDDVTAAVDDAGDDLVQAGEDASNNVDAALEGVKTKLAALKEQIAQGEAGGGDAEVTTTPTAETGATTVPLDAESTATADAEATATP